MSGCVFGGGMTLRAVILFYFSSVFCFACTAAEANEENGGLGEAAS